MKAIARTGEAGEAMVSHSESENHVRRFWLKFLLVGFAAASPAFGESLPLLKSCSDPADTLATIQTSDPLEVRYSTSGDSQMCYAVSVTQGGRILNGFLLGTAHPAVAAFEQEARTHVPEVPPPPKPPAAPAAPAEPKKEPAPAMPVNLAGLKAVDFEGHRIDLSAMRAQNVVLYFWSADRNSIRKTEALENVYGQYHERGVDLVGVAAVPSKKRLREICNENEVIWPQIIDSGQIASQYHVDLDKPYLVLDRQRNVVAAVSSASELDQVLKPLTNHRRVSSQ